MSVMLVVTRGSILRAFHPAVLPDHDRLVLEDIARRAMFRLDRMGAEPDSPEVMPNGTSTRSPVVEATLTQAEMARARGYTGDCCQNCGMFMMKQSGTCLTCDNCGSTSGGC